MEWVTIVAEFSKFGADVALTNGINIKYKDAPMFSEPIMDLADWIAVSQDYIIDSDGAGMTVHHFVSRLSFWKFSPNMKYLPLDDPSDIVVAVNDDLSGSANSKIHFTFEGF